MYVIEVFKITMGNVMLKYILNKRILLSSMCIHSEVAITHRLNVELNVELEIKLFFTFKASYFGACNTD